MFLFFFLCGFEPLLWVRCYFNHAWLSDEPSVEWLGSDVSNNEVF